MRRLTRRPLTIANIGGAVVVLALAGGVAYAATSGSFVGPHGNINACLPRSGGEVNVWPPGHVCSGGRVGLAFPAKAQSGATGSTGLTGATGATGATNPAATTVDGESVTKLLLKEPVPSSGTASVTLYAGYGLTILADCDSSGHASLQANGPGSADSELTISGYENGGSGYYGSQTSTLGPASLAPLGPAPSGEATFSYASSSGQVVTGNIGYQAAPSFGASGTCGFFGSAISG